MRHRSTNSGTLEAINGATLTIDNASAISFTNTAVKLLATGPAACWCSTARR